MKKQWILWTLLGIVGAVLVAGAGVLAYQKGHYSSRWYKNTTINGLNVSEQTLDASKEMLLKERQNYTLTITGRDNGNLVIHGDDIGYQFDIGDDFDKLFQKQHAKLALFPKKTEYKINYNVNYDRKQLVHIVSESAILTGKGYKVKKPVDAHVKYSQEKRQYECVPEKQGNSLKRKNFILAIEDVLQRAELTMDLTDEKQFAGVYRVPKITSEDSVLQDALKACNNAAVRFVTWNMGKGVKEQITPNEISRWITYKKGQVHYDETAIADWIEKLCLKYKTVGKTRTIRDHKGDQVKVYGGDYGWQLDYEKTVSQAQSALKKQIDPALTQAYIDDPSEENRKALSIKRKVVYLNTAFQKDYDKFAVDWDTQNYTEVSIAEQMVYVIRKGKVAFSCKCITGLPVQGRATPTGAFFVKEHKAPYTMTGDDYVTHVPLWVRITWTGTGFHPATWQPWSSWSPTLYQSRGSHGCVNLTSTDAQIIYNMVKYREAVFIH